MPYNLGPDKDYILSDSALNHIIKGDFSEKQIRDGYSKTVLKRVIKGGLHTWQAWCEFLSYRTDVKHGVNISVDEYENWYYARKLQNDVILLKIPLDCFNSKAANITKFPQTFYKSGYLWKTIFPIAFDNEKIIQVIDEALHNIDIEESDEKLIIGYYNKNELFKCIKIRIQIKGKEILSAFPTWSQPMTGNNGKPFSHIDSINTIISSSCLYNKEDWDEYSDSTENKYGKEIIDLYQEQLPEIILARKPIPQQLNEKQRSALYAERQLLLITYGESLSDEEIALLVALSKNDELIKFPNQFIRYSYTYHYRSIRDSLRIRNTVLVYQNLIELLTIINAYDLKNHTFHAFDIISQMLKTRFIITGGLDQWEIKRLANKIVDIIESYNNRDKTINFLKLLSLSPVRVAFYIEFNLNTYFTKSPYMIGFTGLPAHPLQQDHFHDYVAQNLGINYTNNFSNSFNINIVKQIQNEHLNGSKKVKHCVNYAIATDFEPFADSMKRLFKTINDECLNLEEISLIDLIFFDYHRCLAANVQRIISKHKQILSQDLEFGDKEFIKYTKAKHEYKFLWMINKLALEDIGKELTKRGFEAAADDLQKKYTSLFEEVRKIPMPKGVPSYLLEDEKIGMGNFM